MLDEPSVDDAAAVPSSGSRPRERRSAVMADVAKAAGVSHMTVSRVINHRGGVREETRARVLAAMRELDYRPNIAARALVTGRSRTLGVATFDTTLYGPASTLYGIDLAARAAGYFVNVAPMRSLDADAMRDSIDRLREQGVDGIVLIAPQAWTADTVQVMAIDHPMVVVEGGEAVGTSVVAVDQHLGSTRMTQHLLSLGHETVWHVAGPQEWLEARSRLRAWQETLIDAGRDVPEHLVGDWSPRSGYEHGRTLAKRPEVTAVFVANDQMALGVLRAMSEAGVHVPGDVSIAGFDDVPEAAYFSPPLTTVRQDFAEIGRESLRLLLRQLESADLEAAPVVIDPDLILRDSTGPPPGPQPREGVNTCSH